MNNLALSLASSAAAGALTLVPPSGWSSRVRTAYVVLPGVLVAAGGAWAIARSTAHERSAAPEDGTDPGPPGEDPHVVEQRLPVAARVVLVLGLGAATCGVQASSLWIDGVLERALVRRGAAHPRGWMALLAVLASLGMDAAGARVSARTGATRSVADLRATDVPGSTGR